MILGKGFPLEDRFWSNVVQADGCWQWKASTTEDGYGRIFGDGRQQRAHRISWEIHKGPIPEGMSVLHRCDNPPCCNPAHLFLGTTADNMADKFAKGRENLPSRSGANHWTRKKADAIARGGDYGRSDLTDAIVAEIRARHSAGGITQRNLAAEYGIGYKNLNLIITGKTWKHVGQPQGEQQ